MSWEEHIDGIKRDTDPRDFRVPFTDGSKILKKIEDEFIVKEDSKYSLSNWFDRLKDKRKIKEFGMDDLEDELNKLTPAQNYWIVMAGRNPTTKNLVYDSKPNVILQLLCRREEDFYIVDKRYRWLVYFKDSPPDIEIFKSGDRKTPWDKIYP
jgi:hypothetical protein